tara:strand:- start:691 stop:1386 length:696 start_codon:yes stop_codon:yes gene_type:complete
MANKKVFIIEDEEDIITLLAFHLEKEGYKVSSTTSGNNIINKVKNDFPDLILLDLMLPGSDGFEICKQLKQEKQTEHIPIIMLTAKNEESTIVAGLELGAEDYVTKPFSMPILIARIRKTFRKIKEINKTKNIRIDDLDINLQTHDVFIQNKKLNLNTTEFKLLSVLASKPLWVYSRLQLIDSIRGDDYVVTDRIIDVILVSLRKKLGKYAKCIETIRGVGYRFKPLNNAK